jgi:hypothetical protein
MPLRRTFFHTANDQPEFPRQRRGLSELLTLGFDVRNALTQSGHPRLECLFFNQALGIAIDESGQALVELRDLALQGGPLLRLPLAIRVETSGKRLRQSFGMCQEGPHCLPHRQLEASRPHLGVGTEAVAAKAIRLRADTPVIRISPGPPFPGAGTQGGAVEGRATGLTLAYAWPEITCPTPRLAGMPAVFLPLLLHRGEPFGVDHGGHGNVPPV